MNDWISASERLPTDAECNIYDRLHPCYSEFDCTLDFNDNDLIFEVHTRRIFFDIGLQMWRYGGEDYNRFVTAWQPLPEPYKPREGK